MISYILWFQLLFCKDSRSHLDFSYCEKEYLNLSPSNDLMLSFHSLILIFNTYTIYKNSDLKKLILLTWNDRNIISSYIKPIIQVFKSWYHSKLQGTAMARIANHMGLIAGDSHSHMWDHANLSNNPPKSLHFSQFFLKKFKISCSSSHVLMLAC